MNTHGIPRPSPESRTPIRARLSTALVAFATSLFAVGVVSGGLSWLGRSAQREAHVAGTAAWWPHLVLLALTVLGAVWLARRSADPLGLLLAPLGTRAAQRITRTASAARRHPTAALRLLISLLPLAVLAYSCWRVGEQLLGGLDPNFTVNAWGGPGYFGAMACHYLDAVLMMAAASGLLHLLLLPAKGRSAPPNSRG